MTIQLENGVNAFNIRVNEKTNDVEYLFKLISLNSKKEFEFEIADYFPNTIYFTSAIVIDGDEIKDGDYRYELWQHGKLIRKGIALKYIGKKIKTSYNKDIKTIAYESE